MFSLALISLSIADISNGERGQPWRIPDSCDLYSEHWLSILILNCGSWYMSAISWNILGGTFNLRRTCKSFVWFTLSKAFSQSNRISDRFECCLSARSNNLLAMKIACVVDFLGRAKTVLWFLDPWVVCHVLVEFLSYLPVFYRTLAVVQLVCSFACAWHLLFCRWRLNWPFYKTPGTRGFESCRCITIAKNFDL